MKPQKTCLTDKRITNELKNVTSSGSVPLKSKQLTASDLIKKDYYSVEEAAILLGVCNQTIYRWEKKGLIQCARTPGGHRRIPQSEIDRIQLLRTTKNKLPVNPVTQQTAKPAVLADKTIPPPEPSDKHRSHAQFGGKREPASLADMREGPQELGAIKTQVKSLGVLLTTPRLRPLMGLVISWLTQLSGEFISAYEELTPLKKSWAQFQAELITYHLNTSQTCHSTDDRESPGDAVKPPVVAPEKKRRGPRMNKSLLQARNRPSAVFWELVRAQRDAQRQPAERQRATRLIEKILEPYQRLTRYLALYPPGTLPHDVCRLLLCHRPREFGQLRTNWSIRSLATVCKEKLETPASSRSQIQRFLGRLKWYNAPQPRLVSPDPTFGEKMKELGQIFSQVTSQDLVLFGDASKLTSRKVEEHIRPSSAPAGFEIPLKTSIKKYFQSSWIMTVFGLYSPTLAQLEVDELPTENYSTFFQVLCTLVNRFLPTTPGTIYVVLDNAPYHRPKHLPQAIKSVFGVKVQILFLPTYSPELNPIESIWNQTLKAFEPQGMSLTELRADFQAILQQFQQKIRNGKSKPLKLHCSVCGHTFNFSETSQDVMSKQVDQHLCFNISGLNPYVVQILSQALEVSPLGH